jgi:hypothetical protein
MYNKNIRSLKLAVGILLGLTLLLMASSFARAATTNHTYTTLCLNGGQAYGHVICTAAGLRSCYDGLCVADLPNSISCVNVCVDEGGYSQFGHCTAPATCYNATCFPGLTWGCTMGDGSKGIKSCSAGVWGSCVKLTNTTANTTTNSTLNNTEILTRLAALEEWKNNADTNLYNFNNRLTLLEQWKLTIQATVDTIKSWLGYSATNTFCQVSQTCGGSTCTESWSCGAWTTCSAGLQTRSCTDSNACGTTAFKPAVSQSCSTACTENWSCGAWGACQPTNTSTRVCTDSNACGTSISIPAGSQACVYAADPRIVTFRTNTASKSEYGSPIAEIVLDYNGDGILECFKYSIFYSSYFDGRPTTLAKTPEGYNVNKYSTKVIIDYGQKYIYAPSNSCTTPTTTVPTAPYTANGREVYK